MEPMFDLLRAPALFFASASVGRSLGLAPEEHLTVGVVGCYDTGRPAITIDQASGLRALVLSVHLPDDPLGPGEFHVRLNVEGVGAALVAAALRLGLFEDTGRRVAAGYVTEYAAVWRLAYASAEGHRAIRAQLEQRFAAGLEKRRATDAVNRLRADQGGR